MNKAERVATWQACDEIQEVMFSLAEMVWEIKDPVLQKRLSLNAERLEGVKDLLLKGNAPTVELGGEK